MPVVQQIPPLTSPPTNVFGLYQYLAQRLPGYDPSEYLRELNSAYIHVWEEVTKLKNQYFTDRQTLDVVTPQDNFDLQYNADGALSGVLSNRFYQMTRVRIRPPSGGLFQTTTALSPNDPEFLAVAANPNASPVTTGPYYYYLFGRNNIQWALPLAAGTTLEFTYTFWPIQLTLSYAGTVSSSGTTVTGVGTNFLSLLQPDFQQYQPLDKEQQEILVELICNDNQIYNVSSVNTATSLDTLSVVAPALAPGSQYIIATLPEIPREHLRVISSVAMAKMYSVDGDDARVREWTAISQQNLQMMKDSLIERQGQNPPRKWRFQYGVGRRNRLFLR